VSNINLIFNNLWWLLLLIPALFITLWPYFRLKKKYRRTTGRIVSLVCHIVIIVMLTSLVTGFKIEKEEVSIKNDVMLVVDTSESTQPSKGKIDEFVRLLVEESNDKYNIGIITFAAEPFYAVKLTRNTRRIFSDYENSDKPEGGASDIEKALTLAKEKLITNPQNSRIILISDGLETDGSAQTAARAVPRSPRGE
jgi:hypothetical protein